MKKVAYLTMMFVALTLMSFSCSKDDDDPIVPQTLEEKYPDWKNLRWVSTDGVSTPDTYPKLEITIVDDEGIITHTTINTPYFGYFSKIEINGNNVTFPLSIGKVTGTFEKNDDKITLVTYGLLNEEHTYVLKIH